MDNVFISSHGIGELYLDVRDMHWYMLNSSYFNIHKEIPFFRLLLEMASLHMRYYHRLNSNRLFLPQIVIEFGNLTSWFILGFKMLDDLTKDLFPTGDIQTLDYCMEFSQQRLNHKKLDFFITNKWKLRETLARIERALFNLELNLRRLFEIMYSLFPKNSKFRKDLEKLKNCFSMIL